MVHTHSSVLLSCIKGEITPFAAAWMDLEMIILSEVSQRKTNVTCYHLHVCFIYLAVLGLSCGSWDHGSLVAVYKL